MKRIYDVVLSVALLLLLVLAYFIGNAVIRGILLLLFSAALILNTLLKLKTKRNSSFKDKFLMGFLLFLEFILMAASIFVIVTEVF